MRKYDDLKLKFGLWKIVFNDTLPQAAEAEQKIYELFLLSSKNGLWWKTCSEQLSEDTIDMVVAVSCCGNAFSWAKSGALLEEARGCKGLKTGPEVHLPATQRNFITDPEYSETPLTVYYLVLFKYLREVGGEMHFEV